MPPIVGAYERPLSLTTMTRGRSVSVAMLLRASQAMPPVSAPSPMTATVCRPLSPRTRRPSAIPWAQDSELDACELSTMSWTDSARLGYPERPPCWRSPLKSWRPVRSLWT